MIGVSQANRILEFIALLKNKGGREVHRTRMAVTYTNPFGLTPDAAPYIFVTAKAVVKFGHTLVGSSTVSEQRMNQLMGARL